MNSLCDKTMNIPKNYSPASGLTLTEMYTFFSDIYSKRWHGLQRGLPIDTL